MFVVAERDKKKYKIDMKANQTKDGKLSQMTALELSKVERTRKLLFYVLTILASIMVLVAIVTTIKNGFTFFTLFPLFFAPMVINNWLQLKAVKDEVKARNAN